VRRARRAARLRTAGPAGPDRRRRRARAGVALPRAPAGQGLRGRRWDDGVRAVSSPDRFNYGPWHDGPDPRAPPVDLRDALGAIGQDVMDGRSPRSALEELQRRGTRNTSGLDELT